jgi:hypothetical protein
MSEVEPETPRRPQRSLTNFSMLAGRAALEPHQ